MTFKPGQSGNPGGRPKENDEVKRLAREHTTEAIERLVHWLRSDNAKASVSAAGILLDRGYGKAAQFLEVTSKNPLEDFSAAELLAMVGELEKRIAEEDGTTSEAHSPKGEAARGKLTLQ